MDIEAIERKELQKKRTLVGALFLVAFALVLVFAYWMGALGISPTKEVHVLYQFAGGIEQGSPVRLGGIKVGRVSDISFQRNDNGENYIRLTLKLSNEATKQITEDSRFYVNLAGLIGERYVEVVPGIGSPIVPDAEIQGVDPPRIDQLLSQGYGIFGDLRSLLAENKGDIKEMLGQMNELSKNLTKLLSSTTPQQKKQISTLLENLAGMSGDMRYTMGQLRKAVNYAEANGADDAWKSLQAVLVKADAIKLNDIRRLMMEDGVKVNFGRKVIPQEEDLVTEARQKEKSK